MHVHYGSGNVAARVAFHDDKHTWPPENAPWRSCGWKAPAFVFAGDRFILRDWAEQKRWWRRSFSIPTATANFPQRTANEFSQRRARNRPETLRASVASQVTRTKARRANRICCSSRASAPRKLPPPSRSWRQQGAVILAGDFVGDAASGKRLRRRATETIDARHRAHPEQSGLPLTDLRAAL